MKSQRLHPLLARYLPVLFAAVLFVAWPTIAQEQGRAPLLVMISVDGMRPDYATAADAHGAKILQLRRFMKEGSYAEGVVGVVPTVTYPSHTTLVTGLWPAKHGIFGNTTFDPLQTTKVGIVTRKIFGCRLCGTWPLKLATTASKARLEDEQRIGRARFVEDQARWYAWGITRFAGLARCGFRCGPGRSCCTFLEHHRHARYNADTGARSRPFFSLH
jgi:hypothetical protein